MTSTTHIWLLAGGGHAKVVADAAELGGRGIAGVFDDGDQPGITALGIERVGSLDDAIARLLEDDAALAHLAIGELTARRRVLERFAQRGIHADRYAAIIHPSAIVSASVSIGRGVFIAPGAIINAMATLADHAIINTGAIIEHDATLGENCHIAPCATLCGGVSIGPDTLIGAGAVVLPGVRIGAGATVGAGSVVLRDLAEGAAVAGNPCRPI